MTAFVSCHDLALQHRELLNEATERVFDAVAVEKLFLLGLTITNSRTQSLFAVSFSACTRVEHIYLLALVDKAEQHSLAMLHDKIEQDLYSLVPATVIVLTATQFFDWQQNSHPFVLNVLLEGFVLYEKEMATPQLPGCINAESLARENAHLFAETK